MPIQVLHANRFVMPVIVFKTGTKGKQIVETGSVVDR
jgi:hypothetical protein